MNWLITLYCFFCFFTNNCCFSIKVCHVLLCMSRNTGQINPAGFQSLKYMYYTHVIMTIKWFLTLTLTLKNISYFNCIETLDSAMFITPTLSNTLSQFTGRVCYQFGSQFSSAVLQNRSLTKGSLCMTISPSACEFWFKYIKPTTKVTDWVTIADTKWIWAHNKSITPCIITENAINRLYRKDPLSSFRTSCNGHSCNTNFESWALGLNMSGLCF